jgi:protein-tyrosine phosphatase
MDSQNLENAEKVKSSNSKAVLRPMCDFLRNMKSAEIPDPYFGGADGFEHVYDLLEDACDGLYKYLVK